MNLPAIACNNILAYVKRRRRRQSRCSRVCDVDLAIRRCVTIIHRPGQLSYHPDVPQNPKWVLAQPVQQQQFSGLLASLLRQQQQLGGGRRSAVIRRRQIHNQTTRRRARRRSFTLTGRIWRPANGMAGTIRMARAGYKVREAAQAPFFNDLTTVYGFHQLLQCHLSDYKQAQAKNAH